MADRGEGRNCSFRCFFVQFGANLTYEKAGNSCKYVKLSVSDAGLSLQRLIMADDQGEAESGKVTG